MLHWMCGQGRWDKTKNDNIKESISDYVEIILVDYVEDNISDVDDSSNQRQRKTQKKI